MKLRATIYIIASLFCINAFAQAPATPSPVQAPTASPNAIEPTNTAEVKKPKKSKESKKKDKATKKSKKTGDTAKKTSKKSKKKNKAPAQAGAAVTQ